MPPMGKHVLAQNSAKPCSQHSLSLCVFKCRQNISFVFCHSGFTGLALNRVTCTYAATTAQYDATPNFQLTLTTSSILIQFHVYRICISQCPHWANN